MAPWATGSLELRRLTRRRHQYQSPSACLRLGPAVETALRALKAPTTQIPRCDSYFVGRTRIAVIATARKCTGPFVFPPAGATLGAGGEARASTPRQVFGAPNRGNLGDEADAPSPPETLRG